MIYETLSKSSNMVYTWMQAWIIYGSQGPFSTGKHLMRKLVVKHFEYYPNLLWLKWKVVECKSIDFRFIQTWVLINV